MPSEEFRAATNASVCATPVWKRFYFVRRNPVIAAPDFPARWGAHGDLGGTFPDGLKRHPRTNYGVVTAMRGGTAAMQRDGIGLLWLGSPEWADRASSDPLHRPTMQQDELRVFQQPVYDSAMLTEQRISKPGPLSKTALLRFFRREGLSDAAFGAACEAVGRTMAEPPFEASVTRCAWGTAVRTPTIAFDSVMEFWFDTPAQATAALEDEAFHAAALKPMDFAAGSQARGGTDRDVLYRVDIFHERVAPVAPD